MSTDRPPDRFDPADVRAQGLEVTVRRTRTGPVVAAVGALDLATAAGLRRATVPLVGGRSELVLDLSALTFIDSTGVHLLIELRRDAEARGGRLRLVSGTRLLRVLAVAGLVDQFDYVDGVAADESA
jgi:anti-anti-sigma factor